MLTYPPPHSKKQKIQLALTYSKSLPPVSLGHSVASIKNAERRGARAKVSSIAAQQESGIFIYI